MGGGAVRPPGHRGGADRDGDRPARPPPVPRHRRTLALPLRKRAPRDNSKERGAGRARRRGTARGWRLGGWRLASLAGGGTLAAARPLGSALSRTWWPVAIPAALAVRRLRLPVAALILAPPLLDWADRRPPLDPARYVAARLLDDAAYSLGVWQGCLARRTIRPLLPVIGGKRPPADPRYRLTGDSATRGTGSRRLSASVVDERDDAGGGTAAGPAEVTMDVRRTHRYDLTVTWTGNRGTGTSGYRDYGRDHEVGADGRPAIAGQRRPGVPRRQDAVEPGA